MPEVSFVTLEVIYDYKRKTRNENKYSETKKTLLLASAWNGQLPRDSNGETRRPSVPSGNWLRVLQRAAI
jgi:hypothetical protein